MNVCEGMYTYVHMFLFPSLDRMLKYKDLNTDTHKGVLIKRNMLVNLALLPKVFIQMPERSIELIVTYPLSKE